MQSSIVTCATSVALLFCVVTPAGAGLAITAAGVADGFSLSVFASGFPHNNQNPAKGPGGTATTVAGNVLVTDFAGSPRSTYSFTDTDGQTPASALNISNVGTDLFGLTNAGGVVLRRRFHERKR